MLWPANAALSSEQRNHLTLPYRRKHKPNDRMKNAMRWESVLNAC